MFWCIYCYFEQILYLVLSLTWASICWFSCHAYVNPVDIYLFKANNKNTKTRCENCSDTRTNVLASLLLPLTTLTMWTIFTFCFRVFTTNSRQVNAGSYFNASIHRRSQQNMLLLNINRINQTGFFQTYLHHSLP